jgi:hypothetical protein
MRLNEWRAEAPDERSMGPKVLAAVEPVLTGLGAEPDPPCWIVWGDDPGARYTILALADAGLVTCHVRVSVPQEGPRASGKLTRWSRVQVGELSVENQGGHTLTSFQVDTQLMRGVDADGGRVTAFALDVFAGLDGRPMPSRVDDAGRSPRRPVPALPAPRGEP